MTELELHLIRQRMASGRLAKAGRGELAVPLPAGYARRPSGEAALDPDEQVPAGLPAGVPPFAEPGPGPPGLRVPGGPPGPVGVTWGHRVQVNYETSGKGLAGRYCCQRRHDTYGEPRCQQMAAPFLDDHVVAQVLSALAPAALELSVTAAAQVEDRRAEADRIWRQRLERADFACDRARRQYQLAQPENRLGAPPPHAGLGAPPPPRAPPGR